MAPDVLGKFVLDVKTVPLLYEVAREAAKKVLCLYFAYMLLTTCLYLFNPLFNITIYHNLHVSLLHCII